MDDLDIKRALSRYVTTNVPPPSVTATGLLVKGRQQQARRAVLVSLGSGGLAGVVAIVGGFVLAPSFSGSNQSPLRPGLNVVGCEESLPPYIPVPIDSVPPDESPGVTEPSIPPESTAYPTEYPTQYPTQYPTEYPTQYPTQYPTEYPTQYPTEFPSDFPSGVPPMEPTRWPSVPPEGPLPEEVDSAKLAAMECYVKGAALVLFPNASFAPASEPPMQVIRFPQLDFNTGWHPVYSARARVHEGDRTGMIDVMVQPLRQMTQPPMPELEVRDLGGGWTAHIEHSQFMLFVRVTTPRSTIIVMADDILTVDQAIALASAPELDLFS